MYSNQLELGLHTPLNENVWLKSIQWNKSFTSRWFIANIAAFPFPANSWPCGTKFPSPACLIAQCTYFIFRKIYRANSKKIIFVQRFKKYRAAPFFLWSEITRISHNKAIFNQHKNSINKDKEVRQKPPPTPTSQMQYLSNANFCLSCTCAVMWNFNSKIVQLQLITFHRNAALHHRRSNLSWIEVKITQENFLKPKSFIEISL